MAILAADLGGTNIKLGIVENGQILARQIVPVDRPGLGHQLPVVASVWRSLLGGSNPDGISMAFPSIVDKDGRIASDIGKYPDAVSLDLTTWARNTFGVPVAIENDARMAAIGEWRYGAGRGYDDLVMVTLGTGIGTGVILSGMPLRGVHGQAGCLGGHLISNYDGRPCACGAIGCAEAEASTSILPQVSSFKDYEQVFTAAESGDQAALQIKERSLAVWSALVVSLIHAYDPSLIVLGGGVSNAGDWLVACIQEYVNHHAWTPWGKVRVVRSVLGDDAALVAGEWLVREKSKHEIAIA